MSSALRVLAGAGLSCCETQKEQLLAGPQKVGYVLVPERSSRIILRPVYFTFCGVLSRKLDCECIFVFGSKKNEASLAGSLFLFESCEQAAGYGAGPGEPTWPSDRCR